ncbi:hypothetical protein B9Z55_013754 [Caenorhabditis nigoni]|uniref:Uncharacterized protein n=1 Tax=Caenorhabditis nigoni TaxID=1611254 RepID=A0A2G5U339_9PELO|nr:hypothetical protein B9Z55_013754 [Caenorhabditis nigoni]
MKHFTQKRFEKGKHRRSANHTYLTIKSNRECAHRVRPMHESEKGGKWCYQTMFYVCFVLTDITDKKVRTNKIDTYVSSFYRVVSSCGLRNRRCATQQPSSLG